MRRRKFLKWMGLAPVAGAAIAATKAAAEPSVPVARFGPDMLPTGKDPSKKYVWVGDLSRKTYLKQG